MSRIGRLPVPVPKDVRVTIDESNTVTVAGPRGELQQQVNPDISIERNGDNLELRRPTDQKRHRAQHGLYRALIANMITGVSKGFSKELEIIGVGTRAEMKNGLLELVLGFSHAIIFVPPPEVTVTAEAGRRGQNPKIRIEGNDKQMVGQVAAKIRSLRPPEPYKGKGVRYADEYVRRKAGKTAVRQ